MKMVCRLLIAAFCSSSRRVASGTGNDKHRGVVMSRLERFYQAIQSIALKFRLRHSTSAELLVRFIILGLVIVMKFDSTSHCIIVVVMLSHCSHSSTTQPHLFLR